MDCEKTLHDRDKRQIRMLNLFTNRLGLIAVFGLRLLNLGTNSCHIFPAPVNKQLHGYSVKRWALRFVIKVRQKISTTQKTGQKVNSTV